MAKKTKKNNSDSKDASSEDLHSKNLDSKDISSKESSAALPEKWVIPIRLVAYLVLASSCAYIYFNSRDLEMSHYIIFIAISAACAMALLDCRMSADFWEKKTDQRQKES